MTRHCTQPPDTTLISGERSADWASVTRGALSVQGEQLSERFESAFRNVTHLLDVVFYFNI
jgi:hypothetical protein